MTQMTNKAGEQDAAPRRIHAGFSIRCAPVAAHLALAVIKSRRALAAWAPAATGHLAMIAGVTRVHVDSRRGTIQILYDGKPETEETFHRFLTATDTKPGGHEKIGRRK